MTDAQTPLSIDWPRHKCGLHITHNLHRDYYETVEQAFASNTYEHADIEPDEKARCIETGEVWVVQWYPDTPVGFYSVAASTFKKAVAVAAGNQREIDGVPA